MAADLMGTKRRWAASAAGALVIVVAALLLLRVPHVPPPTVSTPAASAPAKAALEIAQPGGRDKTLTEEAMLRDQRPLFLPTEYNVPVRTAQRPEAGRTVLDQEEKRYAFAEADLTLSLPAPQAIAEKPVDVMLTDAVPIPLHGFGRKNLAISPFPARGALIEVLTTSTNQRVLALTLPVEAKPPTERPWRPMTFIASVDAAGLVGPLVIAERSEVEEVDKFFQNYLVQTFRIGERLPPGFYRILVGP